MANKAKINKDGDFLVSIDGGPYDVRFCPLHSRGETNCSAYCARFIQYEPNNIVGSYILHICAGHWVFDVFEDERTGKIYDRNKKHTEKDPESKPRRTK